MEEGTSEFESGYSGNDAPEEKPEQVEQPEVAEEKVAEPAEPEVKPDPIQEVIARFDKLEQRTRQTEGHIGNLNHNLKVVQETMSAATAAKKVVSDAPTQSQVNEAITNPKEWDDLKEDFPEWAKATEKLLDARLPNAGGKVDLEALTKSFEEKLTTKVAEAEFKSAMKSLNIAFPDWQEDVKTDSFKAWRDSQPENIQALGASDDPADAAKMMRLYDKFTRKPPEIPEPKKDVSTRQKRIEAAVTPKGSGGFTQSRSDIDEFEAGYSGR